MSDKIIKPIIDKNEYLHLTLHNNLDTLIIYNKDIDVSAASMTVNVGYYNDEPASYGTAHFLEHMLFMGSEKYPDETLFHKLINESGGITNAHTMEELTTYYFQVQNNFFVEILDIWSNFFIKPLFSKNSVEREVNAVNSEHMKNIPNDIHRILSVIKEEIDIKDHPYGNFGCGNNDTLMKPEIRNILVQFYNKYYSSNIMKLVIMSPIPLKDMVKIVENMFSQIRNKNISKDIQSQFPFNTRKAQKDNKTLCHKLFKMVPVKNKSYLIISWQIPNTDKFYEYKPMEYITYLLEHKGEGSIYYNLRQNNLITSYGIDYLENSKYFEMYSIIIELTDEGYSNVPSIVKCINEYINIVKNLGTIKWIHDELMNLNKFDFNYSDAQKPIDFVSKISMDMLKYPPQDYLYGDNKKKQYNSKIDELIKKYYEYLVPSNSIITINHKNYNYIATKSDNWYNAKYIDYSLPKTFGTEFQSKDFSWKLSLPQKNIFIPKDITLYNCPKKEPYHLASKQKDKMTDIETWIKHDIKFHIPKVIIELTLSNNLILKSIKHYLILELFLNTIYKELESKIYYAQLCSTGFVFDFSIDKIKIQFYGYTNTITQIINILLERIRRNSLNKKQFYLIKYNMIKNLENFKYNPGYALAKDYFAENIYLINYTVPELLNEIKKIEINDMDKAKDFFLDNNDIKLFIYGNVPKNVDSVIDQFEFMRESISKDRKITNSIIYINPGEQHKYIRKSLNDKDNNNVIYVFYEFGNIIYNGDVEWKYNIICMNIISIFLKEKFFSQLRTNKQTGYIVKSGIVKHPDDKGRLYGLYFLIQSPLFKPNSLNRMIKEFVVEWYKKFEKIPQKEFDNIKTIIRNSLKEKFISMNEEYSYYSSKISSESYAFNLNEILIKALDGITHKIVLDFYNTYLINKETRKVRILELWNKV